MAHTIAPHQVLGQLAELHRLLADAGLTDEALQRPIDDRILRRAVVRFWMSHSIPLSDAHKAAKKIMGANFVSLSEVMATFALDPETVLHENFDSIPFSDETLKACKDAHFLVPMLPLSLKEMWDSPAQEDMPPDIPRHGAIAYKKIIPGWCLVSCTILKESLNHTWDEQQVYLSGTEKIMTMAEAVFVSNVLEKGFDYGPYFARVADPPEHPDTLRLILASMGVLPDELGDQPDDNVRHPHLGVLTLRRS